MDVFGDDHVAHNLPLIFVSGLSNTASSRASDQRPAQDGGFRIRTDLPAIDSSLAGLVDTAICEHDGSDAPWKPSVPPARLFTVRNVGRVCLMSFNHVVYRTDHTIVLHVTTAQSTTASPFSALDHHWQWPTTFPGTTLAAVAADSELCIVS